MTSNMKTVRVCARCDNSGWVCETIMIGHGRDSANARIACDCGAGEPCAVCNPSSGSDQLPDVSRTGMKVDRSVDPELENTVALVQEVIDDQRTSVRCGLRPHGGLDATRIAFD
jgi:hypothetical protein